MIRILPQNVADQIAAGEVVDRPLSVAKELVENAVDAGASAVTAEIREGGKREIRVTDDGCGIPAEEVPAAFLRHATSKIARAEDLNRILSLGFRGEALASIAAVSRVEMITKTAEAKLGTRIRLAGGQVLSCGGTGCPDGTTVVISDLFYNTPARLKFLKSDSAEAALIIDFFSRMALAYPHIRFRLINNGANLFTTPGKGDRFRAIAAVSGKDLAGALLPLGQQQIPRGDPEPEMSVSGFISRPDASRSSRKHQVFFVNGRAVSSRLIESGLEEAYRDRQFAGRFPAAFLFVQVPPEAVDVNIHPNKKQVRFREEGAVREMIYRAVRDTLNREASIPPAGSGRDPSPFRLPVRDRAGAPERRPGERINDGSEVSLFVEGRPYFPGGAGNPEERLFPEGRGREKASLRQEEQTDIKKMLSTLRRDGAEPSAEAPGAEEMQGERSGGPEACGSSSSPGFGAEEECALYGRTEKPGFDPAGLSVMGVAFGTYIAALSESDFYWIDQHAAHERVFFEEFMARYRAEEPRTQQLLLPLVIHVSHTLREEGDPALPHLRKAGFDIDPFGGKSYRVRGIPAFMSTEEAAGFLESFFDQIAGGPAPEPREQIERIITRSCKAAVKGGDRLSAGEIQALLAQLGRCENPYSCPHGRPVFLKVTRRDLERMFKRG